MVSQSVGLHSACRDFAEWPIDWLVGCAEGAVAEKEEEEEEEKEQQGDRGGSSSGARGSS